MSGFRWRFIWTVALGTFCLISLSAFTAVSLLRQQAAITGVLRENVTSRRASSDLRGILNTLIALETHHVEEVADLHARAQNQIAEIRRLANYPQEQDLSAKLESGFDQYLRMWQTLPPRENPEHGAQVAVATQFLEVNILYPCREIETFNDIRVDETTTQHERVLSQLAWGMAVVGVLGVVAGLVFGYGVARLFARSIRRLQVQIRDAAGKLGREPPEIILTTASGFVGLHEELDALDQRIQTVIQELNDREREIIRAEQLAAVGQLAAGVGHELRNPLTSIKMLVQTGLEGGSTQLTDEDLRIIEGEVRRMERSLQTFLDFARPPRPEHRAIDLAPVLEAVVGLIRGRAEKQQVATKLETHGPLALVADPGQLQQVFVNLVLNALDAMPRGGTLTIRARTAAAWLEAEVADTGSGISPEMLARLFQPFASSKETGLGLGLVISRRIVEDHGGTIGAANRPGGGASFFVRLPLAGPPVPVRGV